MNRIVFSTDQGKMCPKCSQPVSNCVCRKKKSPPARDGIVRVSRQTKGRKGKGVTLIDGIGGDAASLAQLAKKLKTTCGSGGTVKNGVIEIQGDQIERVLKYLIQQGWKAKRAGG